MGAVGVINEVFYPFVDAITHTDHGKRVKLSLDHGPSYTHKPDWWHAIRDVMRIQTS